MIPLFVNSFSNLTNKIVFKVCSNGTMRVLGNSSQLEKVHLNKMNCPRCGNANVSFREIDVCKGFNY